MKTKKEIGKIIKNCAISRIGKYCQTSLEMSLPRKEVKKQVYYDSKLQDWSIRVVAVDYWPGETSEIIITSKGNFYHKPIQL